MMRTTTLSLALLLAASACATGSAGGGGPQGWSTAQQSAWYAASQGSRLMPWDWAMALERPGEPGKFFDGDWLAAKFRLLSRGAGQLPVGMAKDVQDDRNLTRTRLQWVAGQPSNAPWLGFNCSACHTAELHYKGQALRVDGGPGLTDFQSMVEAVQQALVETRKQPDKWDRFAKAVLKTADGPAARTKLGGEVDKLIAWNGLIEAANATPLRPGFARVDAFGHIFNKVALLAGPDVPDPNPSDAPVSYPFLWNTTQANRVQWNGIAENTKITIAGHPFDYGALGRNTGEVIGVYGEVAVTPGSSIGGYKSSVGVDNLNELERLLALLHPPTWPAAFGTIDKAKADRGKALFATHCAGCHGSVAPGDITTPFETKVFTFKGKTFPGDGPPGTDPWMACNAYTYQTRTGTMAGVPAGYLSVVDKTSPPLGDTAPVASMLKVMVIGTLAGHKFDIVKAAGKSWLGLPPAPQVSAVPVPVTKETRLERCLSETNPLLGYRARPLTGIWATAPYLHNGSVPTLWDLLIPPAQRPAEFNVGSREFDPVKVGYVTAPSAENSFRFVARTAAGPVDGNGNQGHDYGNAHFTDDQRWEIVEYLKTL